LILQNITREEGTSKKDPEPIVTSWNTTFADPQTIRVKVFFNNTLSISTKFEKVNFKADNCFRI